MFCRKITFYVRIAYYILYFSCSLSFADTHRVYIHGDIHDNVVSATLMTLSVPQFHQRGLNPGRNITTLPHHRRSPSRISPLAAPIHPLHGHGDSQHSNRPPNRHFSSLTIYSWQANIINNCKTKCRNKRTVWASTEYFRPQTNRAIRIDGKDLKTATIFKYLGSVISSDRMKWRWVTSVLSDR